MDLHLREWPVELNRKLKSKAALEGRTLRDVVVEAAEEWLRQSSNGRERKSTTKRKRR